jgi:hypothetical protein
MIGVEADDGALLQLRRVGAQDTTAGDIKSYYELPDALDMFARDREDRDVRLALDR